MHVCSWGPTAVQLHTSSAAELMSNVAEICAIDGQMDVVRELTVGEPRFQIPDGSCSRSLSMQSEQQFFPRASWCSARVHARGGDEVRPDQKSASALQRFVIGSEDSNCSKASVTYRWILSVGACTTRPLNKVTCIRASSCRPSARMAPDIFTPGKTVSGSFGFQQC